MKWKKGLVVMFAFFTIVVVNMEGVFASNRYPANDAIELLYEGNDVNDSYNYYRVAVKFTAASSDKRETPESLVIFEKNLETGQIRRAHEVTFEDAGKTLYDNTMNDQSFLAKQDAFYYRAFTAKQNSKGLRADSENINETHENQKYEYTCTLTWKGESKDKPVIRKSTKPLIVNVTRKLSTEILRAGTPNMFGLVQEGETFIDNGVEYTIDSKTFPKEYIPEKNQGSTPNKDKIYGIDEIYPEKEIYISNIPFGVFVSNASMQTHVMYTGDKLPDSSKVRFILRSYLTTDNSKELDVEREIPDISEYLTNLATKDMEGIPEDMYPKTYMDVYMGMGKGPQGSLAEDDNKNDVSYLFTTTDGIVHEQFAFRIVDENDNMVPGFMFDFINVKYNPYLFGEYESVTADGFVKPMGYTMLKSNFKVENDIIRPELKISMNKLLGSASDLVELIDFNEKEMKLLFKEEKGKEIEIPVKFAVNEDGIDNKEIIISADELPSEFIINANNPDKPGQTVKAFKSGNYEIKMYIPTTLKKGFTMKDYEDLVKLAEKDHAERKVYPIDFEIIQYEEPLRDREEKLVKVKMEYDIIPYRMPGIN
ncbi:MAG: hypothetical protein GX366_07580 [Epulopiscium sp.]|mgnify:CR=1 FL=1|nr:hypothetical protein [Candidatus Epulonipiscium sp.]